MLWLVYFFTVQSALIVCGIKRFVHGLTNILCDSDIVIWKAEVTMLVNIYNVSNISDSHGRGNTVSSE